jgi:prophage antirepressor-like protein
MTNEIIIFNNRQLRIVKECGKYWFAAMDACKQLSLTNTTRALSSIPEKDITKIKCEFTQSNVTSKARKTQKLLFVSESGLYRLVFKSKKREAIHFQNFVFDELLPTLRETGSYSLKQRSENWLEKRQDGIGIRNAETEVIQRFIEYSIKQGADEKGAKMYYSTFTNEVYKLLSLPKGKRNNISGLKLYQLSLLEMTISNSLIRSMDANIHYKTAYKEAKSNFIEVARIAGFNINQKTLK